MLFFSLNKRISICLIASLLYLSISPSQEVKQPFYKQYLVSEHSWCMPKYQSCEEMTIGISGKNGNGEKDGQVTLHYPMLNRSNYSALAYCPKIFLQPISPNSRWSTSTQATIPWKWPKLRPNNKKPTLTEYTGRTHLYAKCTGCMACTLCIRDCTLSVLLC